MHCAPKPCLTREDVWHLQRTAEFGRPVVNPSQPSVIIGLSGGRVRVAGLATDCPIHQFDKAIL